MNTELLRFVLEEKLQAAAELHCNREQTIAKLVEGVVFLEKVEEQHRLESRGQVPAQAVTKAPVPVDGAILVGNERPAEKVAQMPTREAPIVQEQPKEREKIDVVADAAFTRVPRPELIAALVRELPSTMTVVPDGTDKEILLKRKITEVAELGLIKVGYAPDIELMQQSSGVGLDGMVIQSSIPVAIEVSETIYADEPPVISELTAALSERAKQIFAPKPKSIEPVATGVSTLIDPFSNEGKSGGFSGSV